MSVVLSWSAVMMLPCGAHVHIRAWGWFGLNRIDPHSLGSMVIVMRWDPSANDALVIVCVGTPLLMIARLQQFCYAREQT